MNVGIELTDGTVDIWLAAVDAATVAAMLRREEAASDVGETCDIR